MVWAEGRMQDEEGLDFRPESLGLVLGRLRLCLRWVFLSNVHRCQISLDIGSVLVWLL